MQPCRKDTTLTGKLLKRVERRDRSEVLSLDALALRALDERRDNPRPAAQMSSCQGRCRCPAGGPIRTLEMGVVVGPTRCEWF